ncbi:MAG: hypothetical protein OWV35_01825 [Firmicutes bacterium]|nr:hypothetical protein [Bacillota bacterium]
MTTAAALAVMAQLVLAGMAGGLLLTVWEAARGVWRMPALVAHALDALSGLTAGLVAVAALAWVDWLVIRAWYLAAVAAGYALWVAAGRPWALPVLETCFRWQVRLTAWAGAPVRWAVRGVAAGGRRLSRLLRRRPKTPPSL